MTTWRKNEPTATRREALCLLTRNDGIRAPRGTDFMALGIVWFRGANSPNADTALGTMTNVRRPLTVAAATFTVNHATSTSNLTAAAHGLQTGDGPIRLTTTGALPTGLATATDYWAIVVDANTFKLASTLANAYAGTAVTFSTDGTGTNQFTGAGTSPKRGIDGQFIYRATQTETDHDDAESQVIVDDGGDGSVSTGYSLGEGALIAMSVDGAVLDTVITADGRTVADVMRFNYCANGGGKLLRAGTAYTLRNETDTKDRGHGTLTEAGGRTEAVVDDASI